MSEVFAVYDGEGSVKKCASCGNEFTEKCLVTQFNKTGLFCGLCEVEPFNKREGVGGLMYTLVEHVGKFDVCSSCPQYVKCLTMSVQ